MNRGDRIKRARRHGPVAILAAIAFAAVWYINVEDSNVGHDYARIFHQDPSLIPADLTSLAALHIQTAALVAQMCVTIGLAIAFSRKSDRPDDLVGTVQALAETVNSLVARTAPTSGQIADVFANNEHPGSQSSVDLTEKTPTHVTDPAEPTGNRS